MFRLWQGMQAPMGGTGHLPEAGGLLDQHGPTMEAAAYLSGVWAWLEHRFPREVKPRKKARAS